MVIKLTTIHTPLVEELFKNMVVLDSNFDSNVNTDISPSNFCERYLSDLESFHAYGHIEDSRLTSLISYYVRDDDPAWYLSFCFTSDETHLSEVLDAVIVHNEEHLRMKFYSKINPEASRGKQWSKLNGSRYDYLDEYMIPAKSMPFFHQFLFAGQLLPINIVLRCNFLKQKFRTPLPLGGNI